MPELDDDVRVYGEIARIVEDAGGPSVRVRFANGSAWVKRSDCRAVGAWEVSFETRTPGAIGVFTWTPVSVSACNADIAREIARGKVAHLETRGVVVRPLAS